MVNFDFDWVSLLSQHDLKTRVACGCLPITVKEGGGVQPIAGFRLTYFQKVSGSQTSNIHTFRLIQHWHSERALGVQAGPKSHINYSSSS